MVIAYDCLYFCGVKCKFLFSMCDLLIFDPLSFSLLYLTKLLSACLSLQWTTFCFHWSLLLYFLFVCFSFISSLIFMCDFFFFTIFVFSGSFFLVPLGVRLGSLFEIFLCDRPLLLFVSLLALLLLYSISFSRLSFNFHYLKLFSNFPCDVFFDPLVV